MKYRSKKRYGKERRNRKKRRQLKSCFGTIHKRLIEDQRTPLEQFLDETAHMNKE